MPTIVDIPKHLTSPDWKVQFLAWVERLPSETWVKRDLCKVWQRHNSIKFTADDYRKAGL